MAVTEVTGTKRRALGRGLDALLPANGHHQPWEKGPPAGFFDEEPGPSQAAPTIDPWSSLFTPVPADWFTTAPPNRSWLLRDARTPKADGVLPLGKVGLLIAEGGVGKTMAICQLAIAVATGSRWLGSLDVASPGRVLLALGEEDAEEVHRRMYRARRASNAPMPPPDSIVVLPLTGVPCAMLETDDRRNLTEAPFLRWLRERLRAQKGWRLVVVDPLARFAGPDAETDNAAATRFVQSLESLTDAAGGATVLTAHHTNKVSRGRGAIDASAGRGSTALVDGARWQCSLHSERLEIEDPDVRSRLGEVVTVSFTKSNYSRRADAILLRRDLENGGALIPVAEDDLQTVSTARTSDPTRAAKTAAKEAEREQLLTARARREEELRAERSSAKVAATEARLAATDRALVALLRERPGITGDELRSALAAKVGGCSRPRMQDSLARLGPAVVTGIATGKGHGHTHHLNEANLEEHLR